MNKSRFYYIIHYLIALVWLINGLFCKLLNLVPRHQMIVARILGDSYSFIITKGIGIGEVLMCIWILSRYQNKINAIIQMSVIATMNIIEFYSARDLLLWKSGNIVFAFIFILLIYFNEFILVKSIDKHSCLPH